MPKDVDIRKPPVMPGKGTRGTSSLPGTIQQGPAHPGLLGMQTASPALPEPESSKKDEPALDKIPPKTQGFISLFIQIAMCDIMQKFRIPLSAPQEDLIRKQKDFEQFEEFCKKARGER